MKISLHLPTVQASCMSNIIHMVDSVEYNSITNEILTHTIRESIIIVIIQFNSFIYVLDNSQIWPITAKHKNNSTGYH
jgi:hypothetical protein